MFSMCSELTPRAPVPDNRIPQLMQPCQWELQNDFCTRSTRWRAQMKSIFSLIAVDSAIVGLSGLRWKVIKALLPVQAQGTLALLTPITRPTQCQDMISKNGFSTMQKETNLISKRGELRSNALYICIHLPHLVPVVELNIFGLINWKIYKSYQ